MTPFLVGLLGVVPKLVASWVETRNAIRVEHMRAHFNVLYEERRVQTAIRLHEAELAHRAANTYPLGAPGRLGTLLPASGLPVILVSDPPASALPLSGLVDQIRELLLGVDGFTTYAAMPSGAFARDAGVPRTIDGELGARTVAEAEFSRKPAIVVYFERGRRSLTAHAYLSSVFGTAGGASGFTFTIARYGEGPPHASTAAGMRDTDLPSWHYIDLTEDKSAEPVEIVADTVAWFLLSVLDTYWQITADFNPGLLARTRAGRAAELEPAPAQEPRESYFTRVEREAGTLARAGYEVTAEEIGDNTVGLHLRGPKDVIFVVDNSYPMLPPVVIRFGDSDVHIEAADWSAECTLADIVEALQ